MTMTMTVTMTMTMAMNISINIHINIYINININIGPQDLNMSLFLYHTSGAKFRCFLKDVLCFFSCSEERT